MRQFHNNIGDNKNIRDKLKMIQFHNNIENNKKTIGKDKFKMMFRKNMIHRVNYLDNLLRPFIIMLLFLNNKNLR